jgi:hypothetical protein
VDLVPADDIFLGARPVIQLDDLGRRGQAALDELAGEMDARGGGVDLHARRREKVQGLRVFDEDALPLEEKVGLLDDLRDEFGAQELELGSFRRYHDHFPIRALASLTAMAAFSA